MIIGFMLAGAASIWSVELLTQPLGIEWSSLVAIIAFFIVLILVPPLWDKAIDRI
jgi:hypothetical protein